MKDDIFNIENGKRIYDLKTAINGYAEEYKKSAKDFFQIGEESGEEKTLYSKIQDIPDKLEKLLFMVDEEN